MKRTNFLIVGAMALVGWAGMPEPAIADAGDPLGVTVNGVDVSAGAGEGWTKGENDNLVTLTGTGPYVLSGTNTTDDVSFMTTVPNTVVVVSNLCLTVGDAAKRSPIEIVPDTGTNTLLIAGLGNKVKAKDDKNVGDSVKGAGILVGKGSTLVIDKAEGETDETARLEAWGNYWGAGIGGGYSTHVGDIVIRGGSILADGYTGAGIGSGHGNGNDPRPEKQATVRIEGGHVEAYGQSFAPGIGAGYNGWAVNVEIAGGWVSAVGPVQTANDIGFGFMSDVVSPGGFSVKITGGTVLTDGESYGGGSIGGWHTEEDSARITVSGGSIHADNLVTKDVDRLDVTNEVGQTLHRVRVRRPLEYGEAPAAVTVTGLPEDYNVNDIVEAKEKVSYHVYNGVVAFWLPDGTYFFTLTRVVDGQEVSLRYWAVVNGENVEAKLGWETGVTINGKDVSDTTGDDGWTFTNGIVTITKAGDYTISGTNTERIARLVVEADAKVTLDNLNLTTEFSPIEVHRGHTAKFEVKGTCELRTGVDCSVIRVEEGAVLSLDSREAGNKLSLTVKGLKDAAAIGGRTDEKVGTVWICAGTIEANGGYRGSNSQLHPVTMKGEWEDGQEVALDGYGGNTLVASGGEITLWLPEGVSTVRLDGQGYMITITSTGEQTVNKIFWYGIRVNEKDIGALADVGWRFDDRDKVLTLNGEGPFVLTGKCQSFDVCVVQAASAEVTFDNLTLKSRSCEHAPYQVGTEESEEGSVHATIRLRGINQLASSAPSGKPHRTAGLQVLRQSTVTIDAADGVATEDAVLIASGSVGGAGIGGGHYYSTGKIVINGGTITATGGEKAAGLGSGDFGGAESPTVEAGEVEINGGFITANGGQDAPGLGCGYKLAQGRGFVVTITGGTVVAQHGSGGTYDIASSQGEESTQLQERPIVTGGSVKGVIRGAKTSDGKTPYCVTVPGQWAAGASVALSELPEGCGTNDVFAVGGNVHLWLPNGEYQFAANGANWSATVDDADTTAKLGATQILKANGGTIDFNDTRHWLAGRVPKDGDDILVEITAETTVMLDQQHTFDKIEVSGGQQVVFKLTNDVELTIGTAVSADCRVNLASPKAKVCVPSATGWNNVRSAIFPDWVRYADKDGVRTFLLRSGADPSETVNVGAETAEEAMALVPIQINDAAAAAAGQAKVIKKIVLGPGRYDGTWSIAFEIDEAKMAEGQKLADTLAAFASGENGLASLAGATEVMSVTIPKAAATSGLYYSLLISPDLGFSEPAETAHALADGQNDLTLPVAPADDPKAPRFFKVKVSLSK